MDIAQNGLSHIVKNPGEVMKITFRHGDQRLSPKTVHIARFENKLRAEIRNGGSEQTQVLPISRAHSIKEIGFIARLMLAGAEIERIVIGSNEVYRWNGLNKLRSRIHETVPNAQRASLLKMLSAREAAWRALPNGAQKNRALRNITTKVRNAQAKQYLNVGALSRNVVDIDVKRWFGNMTTKSAIASIGFIFDHYQRMLGNADKRLRAMCKKLRTIPRPSKDVNALRNVYFEHVYRSNYIMRHLETQREEWERAIAKPKVAERMLLPAWPVRIRKSRRTGELSSEMAPDVEAFYKKAGYETYTKNKKTVNDAAIVSRLVSRVIDGAVQANTQRLQNAAQANLQRRQNAVQANTQRRQNAANQAITKKMESRAVQSAVQANMQRQQNAAKKANNTYNSNSNSNYESARNYFSNSNDEFHDASETALEQARHNAVASIERNMKHVPKKTGRGLFGLW